MSSIRPERLDSVISALGDVRQHVESFRGEDIAVGDYNRWIGQLSTIVDGDWDALILEAGEDGTAPAADMLMNIDAAISFLEEYRETAYAVAS